MTVRKWGWRPQYPDQRDIPYMSIRPIKLSTEPLPVQVDLRQYCPPVYDQGELGSCTAQAIAAAYEVELIKEAALPDVLLSRLFIYYNERVLEGTTEEDSGANIRDGIKTIANLGVCLESTWPYIPTLFAQRPPDSAYTEALNHQAIVYASLSSNTSNVADICLAIADGYPVIFGFTVYESFLTSDVADTGVMVTPRSDESVLGGHAVIAVGYDNTLQRLLVRNSWGTAWGQDGYFWMPYSYVQNLARDFWVIKKVE